MQNQLLQLIKNQMFEGFLLVKTSEQRTSANGSKFLDICPAMPYNIVVAQGVCQ